MNALSRAVLRVTDRVRIATHRTIIASDHAGWALDEVSYGIASGLPPGERPAVVRYVPRSIRGRTVHFVNRYLATERDLLAELAPRNRTILTWSHGGATADLPALREVERATERVARHAARVQVWTSLYVPVVERIGVPRERIVVLPLGHHRDAFPARSADGRSAKRALGIPDDATCVGSFQRDGDAEPKLVKGPDILVEMAARLHREIPRLLVLLTGPARGWVCRELERRGIPYRYFGVVPSVGRVVYYHASDVYAVTSREEGGPISLLEAMSAGTPVVTTPVGIAHDLVRDGVNGILCRVDDVDGLTRGCVRLLERGADVTAIVAAARRDAESYDWKALGPRYARELYSWS